jgi:hypothetical protein
MPDAWNTATSFLPIKVAGLVHNNLLSFHHLLNIAHIHYKCIYYVHRHISYTKPPSTPFSYGASWWHPLVRPWPVPE